MDDPTETQTAFSGLIDLAAERLGGKALAASDDFFAEMENLLKPGRGFFIADKFTERGKWMDGWESRRRRTPGHDWCIVQLAVPGHIHGVDIDTNHFLGNHPPYAAVDARAVNGKASVAELRDDAGWTEVLDRVPLRPGSQNLFTIRSTERWTHVRLRIFPDGGVARFRVFGEAAPDWANIGKGTVDLASVLLGGNVVAASDMFFGNRGNLILPGKSINMGDGWESRRRRGPGNDWAIVRLARSGRIERIELDTDHFKGNYPDTCSIDVCHAAGEAVDELTWNAFEWKEVLGRTKLEADRTHTFESELKDGGAVTHVRLNIYPDGGVARLRVFGTIE